MSSEIVKLRAFVLNEICAGCDSPHVISGTKWCYLCMPRHKSTLRRPIRMRTQEE